MDNELRTIMHQAPADAKVAIEPIDNDRVRIELPAGSVEYAIKPLAQLYGTDSGVSTRNPKDEVYAPLLLAIEGTIADYYRRSPKLTDAQVELALKQLGMNLEGSFPDNPMLTQIINRLRLLLSLNTYSRPDVKWAINTIARSVRRHQSTDGIRGYLNFILDYN
jgi:hypothetical protein